MNRKKVFLLFISLVFMASLVAGAVSAQQKDYVPPIVKDFLTFLFKTLPEEAQRGGDIFIIYFKIILFFLVFAAIYYGAEKVFKDKPRIAALIAFVFALITVIMIPSGILLFLFTEFSAVISIVLALTPIFIGIYVRTKIPDDQITLKNIVLILIGVVALFVGGYFVAYGTNTTDAIFSQLGQYTSFGGMIALIAGLILLVTGFRMARPLGGGGTSGETETRREEAQEKEAEKREIREEEAEVTLTMEELKDIGKIHEDLRKLKIKIDGFIAVPASFVAARDIPAYNSSIDDVNVELDELIALDERIKEYAEKIVAEAKDRLVKAKLPTKKRKIMDQKKLANRVLAQYKIADVLKRMVADVKGKLNTTKGLPIVAAALTAAGPIPAPNESTILQDSLNELKKVNNLLVDLFRFEKRTLRGIA